MSDGPLEPRIGAYTFGRFALIAANKGLRAAWDELQQEFDALLLTDDQMWDEMWEQYGPHKRSE